MDHRWAVDPDEGIVMVEKHPAFARDPTTGLSPIETELLGARLSVAAVADRSPDLQHAVELLREALNLVNGYCDAK